MQAGALQTLNEDLERHATTCTRNCAAAKVVTGGIVKSYVDEYYKGAGTPSNPTNGPVDTSWWYNPDAGAYGGCPESDPGPLLHSPCGYPGVLNGLDNFANEEWYGLFATEPGCASEDVDRLTAREAYYRLAVLWTLGGCTTHSPGVAPQARWRSSPRPLTADSTRGYHHPAHFPTPTSGDFRDRVGQLSPVQHADGERATAAAAAVRGVDQLRLHVLRLSQLGPKRPIDELPGAAGSHGDCFHNDTAVCLTGPR